jgi:hypothetical protein
MVSYASAWSIVQRQAIIIIINNVIIITTLKTQKETEDKYSCIVNVELNNIRSKSMNLKVNGKAKCWSDIMRIGITYQYHEVAWETLLKVNIPIMVTCYGRTHL